jgi:hypothetical protein
MPKIPKQASVVISLVLDIAFIIFVAFAMCALPFFFGRTPLLQEIHGYFANKSVGSFSGAAVFWAWMYFNMIIVEACCVALLFLLIRVRKGKVFTAISVSCIRFLSWGCILIAVSCFSVQYFLHMSYAIAFAAMLLGLCLRVVKNVIEEATEIKSENDLTV